jgi:transposase
VAFLEDGRLEIDNNRSERSIKPVVIGRNYVHSLFMFSRLKNKSSISSA